MSGHSHWATIKRSKGVADAKRGQLFTKLGREIEIAARESGSDLTSNFRLRLCVDKAKQAAMPKENIERAILRGTGQLKGDAIEQMSYEGYGPQGTAVIVDVLTDNRNRAVSEVRRIFTRHGGNLAETGAVSWMFERKGYISIAPKNGDADELALMAIDAGADDVKTSEELVEVYTKVDELQKIKGALEASEISFESAELSWVPKTMLQLDNKATIQVLKMIDALEDLDDVQQVYTNLDITDEAWTAFEQEQ